MIRRLVLLSAALASACTPIDVCTPGQDPKPVPLAKVDPAGLLVAAHAHNDYEHPRPLHDALAQRFYSVEADVWFEDGAFEVYHLRFNHSKGTLEKLYLEPLQALVDARGSVHGDGLPFTLWIDFKDDDERLPAALDALLARFPAISTDPAKPGRVEVILTGDRDAKARAGRLLAASGRGVRDSNDLSPDDPPADAEWRAYALSWSSYV
ncbi:MAG: hypothetical protein ACK4N5_20160, partial [Myxococcales bacterium]